MAKTYPALTAMNLCRAPGRGFSRSQACRCAVSIRNGRVSARSELVGANTPVAARSSALECSADRIEQWARLAI